MKTRLALCLLLLVLPAYAQPSEQCSEWRGSRKVNGESVEDYGIVSSPLRGWIAYTNTGNPVSGMTVECFTADGKTLLSSTTTDSSGKFSFPKLKQGTYLLKARRKEVSELNFVVKVSKTSRFIACPIAEAVAE